MRRFSFSRRLSAFVLGAVFLVGGLFKLMDPVGSTLVMEGYLNFLHLGFLKGLAEYASLFFNLLECFIGISLISGIWVRVMRNLTLALLSFFTLLTLLLLIFNPEMDCGCFGQVLHLTHLQELSEKYCAFCLVGDSIPAIRQELSATALPQDFKWRGLCHGDSVYRLFLCQSSASGSY